MTVQNYGSLSELSSIHITSEINDPDTQYTLPFYLGTLIIFISGLFVNT